jgi:hypothetical protein
MISSIPVRLNTAVQFSKGFDSFRTNRVPCAMGENIIFEFRGIDCHTYIIKRTYDVRPTINLRSLKFLRHEAGSHVMKNGVDGRKQRNKPNSPHKFQVSHKQKQPTSLYQAKPQMLMNVNKMLLSPNKKVRWLKHHDEDEDNETSSSPKTGLGLTWTKRTQKRNSKEEQSNRRREELIKSRSVPGLGGMHRSAPVLGGKTFGFGKGNQRNAAFSNDGASAGRGGSSSSAAAKKLFGSMLPGNGRSGSSTSRRYKSFPAAKKELVLDNRQSFETLLQQIREDEKRGCGTKLSITESEEEPSDFFDLSDELDLLQEQDKPHDKPKKRASITRTISARF